MVKTFPCLLVVEVKGLQLHWQRKEQVKFTQRAGLSHSVLTVPQRTLSLTWSSEHCITKLYNKGFLVMWDVNLNRTGTKGSPRSIYRGNLARTRSLLVNPLTAPAIRKKYE